MKSDKKLGKPRIAQKALLQENTRFYVESHDFNGIPLPLLAAKFGVESTAIIKPLTSLVRRELASVVFGDTHPNPHIRALPDETKEDQIAKIATPKIDVACVYPLSKHLNKVVDKQRYQGKPYTMSMALGSPQLEFRAFDLSVLEFYRNDPRYYYDNDDIRGSIVVRSEYYKTDQMAGRDQIILQTFGFCYDEDFNRAVAAYLRYLFKLSPEHQQIWKAKELNDMYRLHPDYYRDSILGDWSENVSIFDAFLQEMKIINSMAQAMRRPPFFKSIFGEREKPREFSFLIRPTLKELNDFVLLLDKIVSDNISLDFFQNEVPYEHESMRQDGKVVVQQKGRLTILDEWIHSKYKTNDWEPITEMLRTFRDIRKKRQRPAHALDQNTFDQKYFHEQRQVIIRAYKAIQTLRLMLGKHPLARVVEINSLVRDGEVWTY
jgi:hypothetical protein